MLVKLTAEQFLIPEHQANSMYIYIYLSELHIRVVYLQCIFNENILRVNKNNVLLIAS